MIRIAACVILATFAGLAYRAGIPSLPAVDPPAAVECRWADSPITLDGKADEPVWAGTGKVRLAWDRSYLYFFVAEPGTFTLKPGADEPGVYEFLFEKGGTALGCFVAKAGSDWSKAGTLA